MTKSIVSITKTSKNPDEISIYNAVNEAINLIGGLQDLIMKKSNVLIIPNMSGNGVKTPRLTTDPRVTAAITKLSIEAGAKEVIVGSASGAGGDADKIFTSTGTRELVEKLGAKVVDFRDEEYISLKIPNGIKIKEAKIAKRVIESDVLIHVPLIKIIPSYGISGALKGMAAILQEEDMVSVLHRIGFFWAITDVLSVVKRDLTVVDGINPYAWPGTSEEADIIISGKDPVAVNAIISKILGFEPKTIHQNRIAAERGLGTIDLDQIEVRGEDIKNIKINLEKTPDNVFDLNKYLKKFLLKPNEIKVIDGNPCRGCLGQILFALNILKLNNLDLLNKVEDLTILVGPGCETPQNAKNILILGKCACHLNVKGELVEGCAPLASGIIKALKQIYR